MPTSSARRPHGLRTYDVLNAANQVTQVLTVPVYLPSDRINPNISSYNTGFSVANTWYNSLAVSVRHPFSNGLEVLANYTWARASDTDQVQGANGTFYGGDPPLNPNNIRAENGPSDIDVRNRFTLAFNYQPHVFSENRIFKHTLDDFVFSGTEIASGGQPIFLGMSGTVFAGSTSATSYGDDGGMFRWSHQLRLRLAYHRTSSSDRPQQHPRTRLQQLRYACLAQHSHPRENLYAVLGGRLQPAQPHHHHRREQHVFSIRRFLGYRNGRLQHRGGHRNSWHCSNRIGTPGLHFSLLRHRTLGLWRHLQHQRQHSLRATSAAVIG